MGAADMSLPPLRLRPVYKDLIWGGDRIRTRFSRPDAPARCAESWEISAHRDGESIVAGGPFDGVALSALAASLGRRLLGTLAPDPARFPLLFKLIDARTSLSVQVHPSAAAAAADPAAEIKNEAWHVLEAAPGARIYAGFRDGVDGAVLDAALATGGGAIRDLLSSFAPVAGDTVFIPSGLVHAIGAGCLVFEVQQSSNTTYRFYDWDRVGADGKPRELHVAAARRSIDFSFAAPRPANLGGASGRLLSTPFFSLQELRARAVLNTAGASFHALFAKSGAFSLVTPRGAERLVCGASVLVPAETGCYALAPLEPGSAALLATLQP